MRSITFLLLFLLLNYVHSQNPIVETNVGTIEGLQATDGDYSMFLGIPYATVNASNPFGNSIPLPMFGDTFLAFNDTAICPQIEEFNETIVGSLDCLHVNVYVPNSVQTSLTPLPVLVWIYGGRFEIGYHGRYLYGPKFIVRHDVILVTVNYRLGPYGFMCLGIPEVPGNQGLKDQHLALKWIKDNINAFGGDPDHITIFGESAGSMSIDFHLHSSTEILFKSVIMQSGHAMRPMLVTNTDQEVPLRIANYLGIQTNDVYSAIDALATVNPHLIIGAAYNVTSRYRPCIEPVFPNVDSFLTKYPINLDLPKVQSMPIMIGFNDNEQLYEFFHDPVENYENPVKFNNRVQTTFNLDEIEENKLTYYITRFYVGNTTEAEDKLWSVIDFDSDIAFNYPAERSLRKYVKNGAEKVYTYVFSYVGERNFLRDKDNITAGGASHADELGYLFDIEYMDTPSERDQLIIDRITTMWTNFVKYSDPTPELSELLPIKWEPVVNGSSYYYLNIDSTLNIGKKPFHERMAFWDLIYSGYKENEIGYEPRN